MPTNDACCMLSCPGYEYPLAAAKNDGAVTCMVKPCKLSLLEEVVQYTLPLSAQGAYIQRISEYFLRKRPPVAMDAARYVKATSTQQISMKIVTQD